MKIVSINTESTKKREKEHKRLTIAELKNCEGTKTLLQEKIHIETDVDLPATLSDNLWEIFEPRIREIIKEQTASSPELMEEYMPKDYFMTAYNIGSTTFHKILKSCSVHHYRQLKREVYNVEQFKKALQLYKPIKPFIKKSFVKAA